MLRTEVAPSVSVAPTDFSGSVGLSGVLEVMGAELEKVGEEEMTGMEGRVIGSTGSAGLATSSIGVGVRGMDGMGATGVVDGVGAGLSALGLLDIGDEADVMVAGVVIGSGMEGGGVAGRLVVTGVDGSVCPVNASFTKSLAGSAISEKYGKEMYSMQGAPLMSYKV